MPTPVRARWLNTKLRSMSRGRLRQLKMLYEEWLLTDDFCYRKVAECEAAQWDSGVLLLRDNATSLGATADRTASFSPVVEGFLARFRVRGLKEA